MDDLYGDLVPVRQVNSGPPGASAALTGQAVDMDELYGGVSSSPSLPSRVELQRDLDEVVARRSGLQQQLESLQEQFTQGKQRVQASARRACILLKTAQLEIARKEEQLAEERHGKREHGRKPTVPQAHAPPEPSAKPRIGRAGDGSRRSRSRSPQRRERSRSRSPQRRERSRSRSPQRRPRDGDDDDGRWRDRHERDRRMAHVDGRYDGRSNGRRTNERRR